MSDLKKYRPLKMYLSVIILSSFLIFQPQLFAQSSTAALGKVDAEKEVKPNGMSDTDWELMKAKRPLPFDNGPSQIDITNYSPEMQNIYKEHFTTRCSKCHTIARPINAPYALPEEWNKYIKKMMKKPGSGISPMVGKEIAKFLIYDSEKRKPEQIAKKKLELQNAAKNGSKP